MPAKRHRATLNEKEERVLAYIRDARSRPVDLAELARECFGEASGKSGARGNSWARNSLRKLKALDLVVGTGSGSYSIPPERPSRAAEDGSERMTQTTA